MSPGENRTFLKKSFPAKGLKNGPVVEKQVDLSRVFHIINRFIHRERGFQQVTKWGK